MVGVGRLLAAMARRSARRGSWRVGSAAMVIRRGIGYCLLFGECDCSSFGVQKEVGCSVEVGFCGLRR